MAFNKVSTNCAPYCFPTGKEGGAGLGTASCVKYCTPAQDVMIPTEHFGMTPGKCKCRILKRIDCFLHDGTSSYKCGQFKMLMGQSHTSGKASLCKEICAGQVAAF